MAQLISDFPQLALDTDSHRIEVFAAVYEQLTAMGLPTPGPSPAQITRAQLLNFLQKEAGKIVKQELQDAKYNGKTDEEQTALVNDYHKEHGSAPPVNRVFIMLPFAPNALTLDDTKGSKNNGTDKAEKVK